MHPIVAVRSRRGPGADVSAAGRRGAGRRTRAARALVVACGLLTAALTSACTAVPSAREPSGMPRTSGSAGAPGLTGVGSGGLVRSALALLDRRVQALATDDRAAWIATVADPTSPDGLAETAAFDALRLLGVESLVAETAAYTPDLTAGSVGEATVAVRLGYRIAGFDRGDRSTLRTLRVRRVDGDWRIVRWLGPGDVPEVFDLPGLAVVRTERVLIAGPGGLDRLLGCLADAEFAQGVVEAVLGRAIPVVLVDPVSVASAAALVGRSDPSGLREVAATTVGPRPAGTAAVADRVVLNPDASVRLTDAGRRQVLAHEFTHVTVRAHTRGELPMWLSEGVAEYVGYAPVDLAPERIAAQALDRVRSEGPPTALPDGTDFAGTEAAAAYQGSWLAVRRLARALGPGRLLGFLTELASAPTGGFDALLRRETGQSEADFVAAWRADLVARARP